MRYDEQSANHVFLTPTILSLNANMLTLAEELSVSFLPNRSHYFLQSDEINDDYYYDDVHLTLKGSEKLPKSMNLIGRSDMDTCSLKPSQIAPMTRSNPRSRHSLRTGKQPARGPDRGHRSDSTKQAYGKVKPNNSRGSAENHSYQKHTMNSVARTGNPDTPDDFNSAEFWRKMREKTSNQRTYPSRTTHYTTYLNKAEYCKKCGEQNHDTSKCFHRNVMDCHNCKRKGHKSKLCHFYPWRSGQGSLFSQQKKQ